MLDGLWTCGDGGRVLLKLHYHASVIQNTVNQFLSGDILGWCSVNDWMAGQPITPWQLPLYLLNAKSSGFLKNHLICICDIRYMKHVKVYKYTRSNCLYIKIIFPLLACCILSCLIAITSCKSIHCSDATCACDTQTELLMELCHYIL